VARGGTWDGGFVVVAKGLGEEPWGGEAQGQKKKKRNRLQRPIGMRSLVVFLMGPDLKWGAAIGVLERGVGYLGRK